MHKRIERQSDWRIDRRSYSDWLGERASLFPSQLRLDRPNVRSAVFLALLEAQDQPMTYRDIGRCLARKRVTGAPEGVGSVPVMTLRVAVSELSHRLNRAPGFRLKTLKIGREARFQLQLDRARTASFLGVGANAPRLDPQINDPRAIAETLVRDGGGLPFSSLYSTYRAASWWLSISTKTALEKRNYEAGSIKAYGIREHLSQSANHVFFAALAPGEGLGEVSILEQLLRPKYGSPVKVHYWALDTSEILMMSHYQLLTHTFADEISRGDLTITPMTGDLYRIQEYLTSVPVLAQARTRCQSTLVTFLGNCLGNNEGKEWDFFKMVDAAFPRPQPLAILVGVSCERTQDKGEVVPENYTLDPFFTEVPRYLLQDLKLLESRNDRDECIESSEFIFDKSDLQYRALVPGERYSTPNGVCGSVYRFHYSLRHRLALKGGAQSVAKGTPILLYSIIKYDLDSLLRFIKARGFAVKAPPEYPIQRISEGNEEFRYATFAVLR
ncbi:MAG: L-histidine N(alpha)-methyltransferase [Deltaproteobacteria bacterium]|nr:L-histidine N(alpha)-methyltransferase [Deltaproteobacteria bacterium]MBI3294941.1 L-histidine N(alpha)-methyltransferase [Deltaproteobacteria bacterium]